MFYREYTILSKLFLKQVQAEYDFCRRLKITTFVTQLKRWVWSEIYMILR